MIIYKRVVQTYDLRGVIFKHCTAIANGHCGGGYVTGISGTYRSGAGNVKNGCVSATTLVNDLITCGIGWEMILSDESSPFKAGIGIVIDTLVAKVDRNIKPATQWYRIK
jgi:hypothetical protein